MATLSGFQTHCHRFSSSEIFSQNEVKGPSTMTSLQCPLLQVSRVKFERHSNCAKSIFYMFPSGNTGTHYQHTETDNLEEDALASLK